MYVIAGKTNYVSSVGYQIMGWTKKLNNMSFSGFWHLGKLSSSIKMKNSVGFYRYLLKLYFSHNL